MVGREVEVSEGLEGDARLELGHGDGGGGDGAGAGGGDFRRNRKRSAFNLCCESSKIEVRVKSKPAFRLPTSKQ